MSDGYVIAEMPLQDNHRVRVEQHARTSKSSRQQVRIGRVVFENDILADIIVRGIRSIEEERERRLDPLAAEVREFNDYEDRLLTAFPGHGAG